VVRTANHKKIKLRERVVMAMAFEDDNDDELLRYSFKT
jgi:hypothetical protein